METDTFNIENYIVGGEEIGIIGGSTAKAPDSNEPWLEDSVRRKLVPAETLECALYLHKKPGEPCASDAAIEAMKKVVGESTGKSALEEMKKKTKCKDERCVLSSSLFVNVAGPKMSKEEVEMRLKVEGPTSTALLSNFNIDKVLGQWMQAFPDFFAYNFNMLNFEDHGDTLASIDIMDLYNEGYRCFACVINSDVYEGAGKHWMALFGDMRSNGATPWTVEFFNSSGNAPASQFAKWLVKTKNRMEDILREKGGASAQIVKASEIMHQKSQTECGPYSLYYIWARLNRVPWNYFKTHKIPDDAMFEFRQHLFYDKSRPVMKKYDFDEYSKTTKIKWET